MDEGDKLLGPVCDNFLDALQGKEIKPDQLRYAYPADSLILFTANDPTVFSGPLNDRMFLIEVPYTDNRDTSHGITRKAYHGEVTEASQIPIGDTHNEKTFQLRQVPMSVILERTLDALYIQFRKEYNGPGKNNISASNRSKIDALDIARAKLLYDRVFYTETPHIVDDERTMVGIEYALSTRVQEPDVQRTNTAFEALRTWIRTEFPKVLEQEQNTWWCRTYQELAIAQTQIPELGGYLVTELADYEADPAKALPVFEKVKRAHESTVPALQRAKLEHPFMNHLFKEQPRFARADKDQVKELIAYYMESKKHTVCQIPNPPA